MTVYHYTECGLNNVFIEGMEPVVDDAGEEIIFIPAINELHKVIAHGIVCHDGGISGVELRFLRTEIGLTQAELAKIAHVDKQTIGRWERSETEMDGAAEALIRRLAIERLGIENNSSIEELSSRSVPTAQMQEIRILAANDSYELTRECIAA